MKQFALVCGASGAIGAAICHRLAEEGWSLYLHYGQGKERAQQLYEALSSKYPTQEFMTVQADFDSVEAAKQVATQVFNLQAIVFANGQAFYGLLEDHNPHQMQSLWKVHVQTPMLICSALASKLRQHEKSYITFVSSIWGEPGAGGEVVYSAVKGAQNSFVKAYAQEVAFNGIRVNAVAPGIIETSMNHHLSDEEAEAIRQEIPLQRYGQPSEIANAVNFLMSGQGDYMTGQIMRVNGGWYI